MSKIEWTDRTWNVSRGCSRVSEGCRNCYAERMAARFSGPGAPFHGFAHPTPAGPRWTGRVELIQEKLDEPLHWRKPSRVFVNSMSDLFHEALSFEHIESVFRIMAIAERHTFQVLTKRPARMREFCLNRSRKHSDTIPSNVWLGVSVEDQATADARIPPLLQTPAAVRFVSYEPALGSVDFTQVGPCRDGDHLGTTLFNHGSTNDGAGIDWLIIGGESGPGARPFDLAWARSVLAQCRKAGVPCFVKQLGGGELLSGGHCGPRRRNIEDRRIMHTKGGNPDEWPADLRVREFPATHPGETP
jgi:protein gp37